MIRDVNPWVNLAAAVLAQAIGEYKREVKKSEEIQAKTQKGEDLEKFFLSSYGQTLSFGQGEYLIRSSGGPIPYEQIKKYTGQEREDVIGKRPRKLNIYRRDNGEIYENVQECATATGLSMTHIYAILRNGYDGRLVRTELPHHRIKDSKPMKRPMKRI